MGFIQFLDGLKTIWVKLMEMLIKGQILRMQKRPESHQCPVSLHIYSLKLGSLCSFSRFLSLYIISHLWPQGVFNLLFFSHIFLSFSSCLSCALNSLPKHTNILRLCLRSKWNELFSYFQSVGWTFLTYFASDETESVCSDSVIDILYIYIDRHSNDFSISLTAEHMRVVVMKESEDRKLNTVVSTRIHHFQNENHNIIFINHFIY